MLEGAPVALPPRMTYEEMLRSLTALVGQVLILSYPKLDFLYCYTFYSDFGGFGQYSRASAAVSVERIQREKDQALEDIQKIQVEALAARFAIDSLEDQLRCRDEQIHRSREEYEKIVTEAGRVRDDLMQARAQMESLRSSSATTIARLQQELDTFMAQHGRRRGDLQTAVRRFVSSREYSDSIQLDCLRVVRRYTDLLASKFPDQQREIIQGGRVFAKDHFHFLRPLPSPESDAPLGTLPTFTAWQPRGKAPLRTDPLSRDSSHGTTSAQE